MAETLTLSEQKHLDILEAATAAFIECGYRETSMDAIAERAAVSKRTVYNHFDSKEALFEEITGRCVRRFKEDMRADYDASKSLRKQLRHIADLQVETFTDKEVIATAKMFLDGLLTSPESSAESLQRAKMMEDPLIEWVRAAVDDGRFSDCNPDVASHLFRSLLESIFMWPSILGFPPVPTGTEREAILNNAVDMFLGFYAKPEAD